MTDRDLDHELPPDPDLSDLPPEVAEHDGPLKIEGIDDDGNVWEGPVERIDIARGFADRRRVDEADE